MTAAEVAAALGPRRSLHVRLVLPDLPGGNPVHWDVRVRIHRRVILRLTGDDLAELLDEVLPGLARQQPPAIAGTQE